MELRKTRRVRRTVVVVTKDKKSKTVLVFTKDKESKTDCPCSYENQGE